VGTSSFSSVLTVFAAVAPSVPLDFAITGSGLSRVSLAWTAPLNDGGAALTGYYLYYRLTGTNLPWLKSELISEDTNAHTISALDANRQYSFKITAANIKGESE